MLIGISSSPNKTSILGTSPNNLGSTPNSRPSLLDSRRLSNRNRKEFDEASDKIKAELLRKHLVSREERSKHSSDNNTPINNSINNGSGPDEEEFTAPLDVPGADITYVWILFYLL